MVNTVLWMLCLLCMGGTLRRVPIEDQGSHFQRLRALATDSSQPRFFPGTLLGLAHYTFSLEAACNHWLVHGALLLQFWSIGRIISALSSLGDQLNPVLLPPGSSPSPLHPSLIVSQAFLPQALPQKLPA